MLQGVQQVRYMDVLYCSNNLRVSRDGVAVADRGYRTAQHLNQGISMHPMMLTGLLCSPNYLTKLRLPAERLRGPLPAFGAPLPQVGTPLCGNMHQHQT